jgi:hypothetical protein
MMKDLFLNDKNFNFTPLFACSDLEQCIAQIFFMARLRFGAEVYEDPDFNVNDLFGIKAIEYEGETVYVAFFMNQYSNNPIIDTEIQLAVITPALFYADEVDFVFHIARCQHAEKEQYEKTGKGVDCCTGLFMDRDGAQFLYLATIDECKKLAHERLEMEAWINSDKEGSPEIKEGADLTDIDQPNKDDSIWRYMGTKNVFSEPIEMLNRGLRMAKQKAKEIEKEIEEQDREIEKNIMWN